MKNFFSHFGIGLITTIFAIPVFAGKAVGNGGHGLKCGVSVQVLDFYEATHLNGFTLDFSGSTTRDGALKMIANRLRTVDPKRAALIDAGLAEFYDQAQFVDHTWIQPTDDAVAIAIPNGCELVQIINRRVRPLPYQKKYLIDLDLWNQLDPHNQAMLVTHELLYEQMEKENTDASGARFYNSLLWSDKFASLSEIDNYVETSLLRFDYSYLGECHSRGYSREHEETVLDLESFEAKRCSVRFQGRTYDNVNRVFLSRRGKVWFLVSLEKPPFSFVSHFDISGGTIDAHGVLFDDEGYLKEIRALSHNFKGPFHEANGEKINCNQIGHLWTSFEVDRAGNLVSCTTY